MVSGVVLHTISNKVVSKVFAQKKGDKVMTATNVFKFVQISEVSGIDPP